MEDEKVDVTYRDKKVTPERFKLKMQMLLDQPDMLPVRLIGANNKGTVVMTTGCGSLENIAEEALEKVLAHLETHT